MNKTFKKEDGVLIAEGKSAINYYDFRGCKELKTVVIPGSVVIINEPVVKVRTGWHHTDSETGGHVIICFLELCHGK